jgi:dTDP-4-dehydrorhamnose reductase
MTKILVLGTGGMVGHKVAEYLHTHSSYKVIGTYNSFRPDSLAKRGMELFKFNALAGDLGQLVQDPDYVINCIGVIKHRAAEPRLFYLVNSLFPKLLSEFYSVRGAKIIQISSDCVFSGKKGNYTELDACDAEDDYGLSKFFGENQFQSLVLRCSLVGPELTNYLGLYEWVRRSEKPVLPGYTNWKWNGLTTTQFAEACKNIIDRNLWTPGIRHVYGQAMSKFDLIQNICESLGLNKEIYPSEVTGSINRTLSTHHEDFISGLKITDIKSQLRSLNN